MCRVRKITSPSLLRSCPWVLLLLLAQVLPMIPATAQSLPNRRYTTRDGLLADRITVIAQDHEGYMWMGSLFGISKYDGNRFTTIRLPAQQQHKYVTSLLSVHNKMYAGFLFGGGILQYEKGSLKSFLIPSAQKPVNNDITALFEDENGILVTNTVNQVYHFANEQFTFLFSLNTSVTTLLRDAQQRIWIGTPEGIFLFEKGKLHPKPIAKGAVMFMRNSPRGIMVVRSEGNQTFFSIV